MRLDLLCNNNPITKHISCKLNCRIFFLKTFNYHSKQIPTQILHSPSILSLMTPAFNTILFIFNPFFDILIHLSKDYRPQLFLFCATSSIAKPVPTSSLLFQPSKLIPLDFIQYYTLTSFLILTIYFVYWIEEETRLICNKVLQNYTISYFI